jgi:hypothetical protein
MRRLVFWDLRGAFFEAFCSTAEAAAGVVERSVLSRTGIRLPLCQGTLFGQIGSFNSKTHPALFHFRVGSHSHWHDECAPTTAKANAQPEVRRERLCMRPEHSRKPVQSTTEGG